MTEAYIELIKSIPWGAAIITVVFLFLRHMKEMETMRINAAKEKAADDRTNQMAIANMQANGMKEVVEGMKQSFVLIAEKIAQHDKESKERYDKIGNTKDLIKAIKDKRDQ